MSKGLEKYDKLVVFILIMIASVLAIGWWFAEEKSTPEYSSKIDKLMFDKDNKSPKWVITLPDNLEPTDKSKLNDVEVDVFEEIVISKDKNEETFFRIKLIDKYSQYFQFTNKKTNSRTEKLAS